MEYVQGRTLADILAHQRAAHLEAGRRDRQRGRGRARLRPRQRVVHRDIKPANILIGANGQVKVADFGIARAMNAPTEINLTQVGSVMGTATYFSPEQAQGAQPDPRSDLYSLGIVMYEMVAGRPPFTGENPVSIAYKQVHDSPQPLEPDRRRCARDRSRRSSPSCSPRTRRCATRAPTALRDDLRRFRNDEPVQALAAAANARAGAAGQRQLAGAVARSDDRQSDRRTHRDDARRTTRRLRAVDRHGRSGLPDGRIGRCDVLRHQPVTHGLVRAGRIRRADPARRSVVSCCSRRSSGDEGDAEPAQFVLDDYTNKPLEEVIADLTAKNIRFVTTPEESALVAVNFVVRTDPPAGTLILKDDTVEVFFNPDPQLVPVPNVVTLPITEASSLLAADGFVVGTITNEERDDLAENTVISSDPAAGTPALQGTVVNLVVSPAPLSSVQVPGDVIGMTEVDARALLAGRAVRLRRHHRRSLEIPGRHGHGDPTRPRRVRSPRAVTSDHRVERPRAGAGTRRGRLGPRHRPATP